jgi:hypothetical protein
MTSEKVGHLHDWDGTKGLMVTQKYNVARRIIAQQSEIMPVIRDNNKSLSSLDVLSFCCIHQLKPFTSCMGGASYNFGCEELR